MLKIDTRLRAEALWLAPFLPPAEAVSLRACVHSTDSLVRVRYCRTIFCPECWQSKAQDTRHVVLKQLRAQPLHTLYIGTVTMRDCPLDQVRRTIEALSKGVNKALYRCRWSLGCFRTIEVAPSKYTLGHERVHSHFILVVRAGKDVNTKWLEGKWAKAGGKLASSKDVFLRPVTNLARDVKYVVKSNSTGPKGVVAMWKRRRGDPPHWIGVLGQIKGTHVYQSSGVLKARYRARPVSTLELLRHRTEAGAITGRRNARIRMSRRDYLLKPSNRPIPVAD